jgi:hypothetical protein
MTARREHACALGEIARRVGDVLDHRVREDQIEHAGPERQRHAVGEREVQVGETALAAEPYAGLVEARRRIDPDHRLRLLGERQWHAAAAAAGIEHTPAHGHSRPLEKRDDLGAAVILEQRVVVFGAEPEIRMRLDGALVDCTHV